MAAKIQINLRLTAQLRKQLKASAKARGVSLNSEMIARIEKSYLMDEIRDVVRSEFSNWHEPLQMKQWTGDLLSAPGGIDYQT